MGSFASVFKELRTKSGLTQQDMADKLQISRSSIGMYESGEREPSFELLESIADFFNVDMDYLLGRTDKTTLCPETIGYYLNEETAKVAQSIFENKELRLLFDAARDASPEDLETVHSMLLALKRKERGNID